MSEYLFFTVVSAVFTINRKFIIAISKFSGHYILMKECLEGIRRNKLVINLINSGFDICINCYFSIKNKVHIVAETILEILIGDISFICNKDDIIKYS